MKYTLKISLSFFILFAVFSYGGVNIKNGNFYISYTDYSYPAYKTAMKEVSRTYNSKSIYEGAFGFGWNSKFETFISIYPDNSIVLHENGGGLKVYFSTDFSSMEDTDQMIEILIETAIQQMELSNNPSDILAFRQKLKTNLEYRTSLWDKFVKKGLLAYRTDNPENMEWIVKGYGTQKIIKIKEGYLINRSNGENEFFNEKGKLIKIEKQDGTATVFEYLNDKISKIKIADDLILDITTNQDGYITKISSSQGTAYYKYDGKNLVESTDTGKNTYKYVYDSSHNLTSIIYDDNSSMVITYHPKTLFTKSVTDRHGETKEYEYVSFYNQDGSVNDDHYGTKVYTTNYYGEKTSNYYEYLIKTKLNGQRFTYRIITEVNGYRTTTIYDEICTNNTISITKGDETTSFKYNSDCNLTEKVSPNGEKVTMEYHPVLKKMTKVTNEQGVTIFEYDDKANLTLAKLNDEKWVRLIYNEKGQITFLENDESIKMKFEYNAIGKPTKMELIDVGIVTVEYDNNGEITKVDSTEGHSTALKVTQTFQSLLSLVKPAGVNLNF